MYEEILYDVDERIATITLNRPDKLNAVTDRTQQEMRHAIATAEMDEEVVGIILTGAGRGFCAGVDMGSLSQIQEAGEISAMRVETDLEHLEPGDKSMGPDFASGYAYLLTVRKPILAAVNGACAGLGFSIAMFCDLRFASEKAVFLTSFAQRGLVAEHGNSWILPRLIGPSRALDLLWSGRRVGGEEAVTLGIANRVFPPDELITETRAYIRSLVETASPTSLMHMKQMVYRHLMLDLGPAMKEINAIQDRSVKWPDFQEGIASFVERRPPRFPSLHPDD